MRKNHIGARITSFIAPVKSPTIFTLKPVCSELWCCKCTLLKLYNEQFPPESSTVLPINKKWPTYYFRLFLDYFWNWNLQDFT